MKSYSNLKVVTGMLVGVLMISLGAVLGPINRYALSGLLIACAIFLYFYTAVIVAHRNWFDIRAVFSAAWVATIGLAALRLTDYQTQWEPATWYILGFGFGMFYLGGSVGVFWGKKFFEKIKKSSKVRFCNIVFRIHPERLFWICFGVTLFGLACFIINVAIKGYIPYFSRLGDAYLSFYTKFYLFAVAATMISGLSYYTLVTQKLSWWKKVFLCFSILYSTFLFPMLVVSRGVFLTSVLALTTVLFYVHKKRFVTLVLCAIVIVGFYMKGTNARGYSEEQLNAFFEPSHLTMIDPSGDKNGSNAAGTGDVSTNTNPTDGSGNSNSFDFQLSGTAAFVYSYLTVSHDNFNEAVRLTQNYTWGVRQLAPFNVVLRIDAISEAQSAEAYHFVRPHLNTVNLAGDAYYDFGPIGVVVLMFIWAAIFGVIQSVSEASKGPFGLMALGNTMTPVTMCFFASWMSIFSHWMHWGFVLILFFIASVSIDRKPCSLNAYK